MRPTNFGEALSQWNAATPYSNQAEVVGAVVLLDDLVGETNDGALDLGGRHELRFLAQVRGVIGGFGHSYG